MNITEEVESLKQSALFSKIDPARLKLLAFTSERQSFKPGEFLVQEGDIGTCAYLILQGYADVLLRTQNDFVKVAEIGVNEIVGDIAILCDVRRTASVRAQTQIETLCISKDTFLNMIREFPDMALEIIQVLGKRLEQSLKYIKEH